MLPCTDLLTCPVRKYGVANRGTARRGQGVPWSVAMAERQADRLSFGQISFQEIKEEHEHAYN